MTIEEPTEHLEISPAQLERKMPSPHKTFNDPVHGAIEMDWRLVKLIDTPQFQRLRYLKQLGLGFFVYPGAVHTRLEHSIGTCHLAELLMDTWKKSCTGRSLLEPQDELCVKIAALLHDLGHGPFSHFWEVVLEKHRAQRMKVCGTGVGAGDEGCQEEEPFRHEQMSLKMIDLMREENPGLMDTIGITEDDVLFIKELIHPKGCSSVSTRKKDKSKNFLYEIVSNSLNGIDVDKMDYIMRDTHHIGASFNFECKRIFSMSQVLEDPEDGNTHICYRDKEIDSIRLLFDERKRLHRRVYQHRVTKRHEDLLCRLFLMVGENYSVPSTNEYENELPLLKCHLNPRVYMNLTDGILEAINMGSPKDYNISRARQILKRINCRDFGCFINEAYRDECETFSCEEFGESFQEYLVSKEIETNVSVYPIKLDFGMKSKNPLLNVYLYQKDSDVPFLASDLDQTFMDLKSPRKIEEHNLVVYADCVKKQVPLIRQMLYEFSSSHKVVTFPMSDASIKKPIKRQLTF